MDFGSYIEEGVQKAGSRAALAEALAVSASQITNAKDRGVPVSACYALAELIGRDAGEIIAASELVTEKKPERRAVLMKYLAKAVTASNIAACALIMTFGQSQEASASPGTELQQSGASNFQKFIRRALRALEKLIHRNFKGLCKAHNRVSRHLTALCDVAV